MKKCLLSLLFLATALVNAQVLIDDTGAANTEPHGAAALEVRSNDKGLLIPVPAQAPANPVEGIIYFDTTDKIFKGYNGTEWVALSAAPETPITTNYTISIVDAEDITEGGTQEFTVTISPALKNGDEISVDYYTLEASPVSATEDSDYTSSLGTVTFSTVGESTSTISVTTIDDSEVEGNETYKVALDSPQVSGNATASLSVDTATGTILDNETPDTTTVIEILEANIQDEWNTSFTNTSGYVANDYSGVRLGSGSKGGVIEYNNPITFNNTTGTVIVTIGVKGWDAGERIGRINVGGQMHDFTVTAVKEDSDAEIVTHTFTNVPNDAKVSFESTGGDKRFIIYSIKIEKQN